MIDTAEPAGKVKGQIRPHQGPAQPRPGTDPLIDIGDACYPLGHQMQRLPPQRRLQPVGDISRHLALNVCRLLADRSVEGERAFDSRGTRLLAANDLDQRQQMRGLKGWPMTQRSGCRQSFCSRLINSPDELDAMTISGLRTASNWANKARFNSSRSGALPGRGRPRRGPLQARCGSSAPPGAVRQVVATVARDLAKPRRQTHAERFLRRTPGR